MAVHQLQGILESFQDITPVVRRLFIRIRGTKPFDFRPGQYVSVTVPLPDRTLVRAYSIASPPGPENCLELCFKLVGGGAATEYLRACPIGTTLALTGPAGSFTLQYPLRHDTLFVAAGTGITPIRSMLLYLFREGTKHQITLLYGARYEADILYQKEFEALESRHPNFRFIPTLSRPDDTWEGKRGHVQDLLERILEGRPSLEAYLCGMESMVRQVRDQLMALGISRAHVHTEEYLK